MIRTALLSSFALVLLVTSAGCSSSSEAADDGATGTDDVVSDATLKLTSDHQMTVVGQPKVGGGLRVEYALDRLPQCRGNVGGGGPAWNITGYYSLNNEPVQMFEVSELSADGRDRVAKPARLRLTKGGDLALWFQVSSGFGCSEYDSSFGQNYHVAVDGPTTGEPTAEGTLTFKKDGSVAKEGALRPGQKVRVRYEQDRLPQCHRQQGGNAQWAISGFSKANDDAPKAFETARANRSGGRDEIDAFVDLPNSGKVAFWFEVASVGGCHEVDSKGGQNYVFDLD